MSDSSERGAAGVYREADGSGPGRALLRLTFDEAVVVLRGSVRLDYYPDRPEVVVGRGAAAQLWVDDDGIARKHCRLLFDDGGVTLEDLGSTGGVRLETAGEHPEGRRVQREALHEGDRFHLGPGILAQVERRRPGVKVAPCADGQHLVEVGAGCPFCQQRQEQASGFVSAVQPGPEPVATWIAPPPVAPWPASWWMSLLAVALVLVAIYLLFQVPG